MSFIGRLGLSGESSLLEGELHEIEAKRRKANAEHIRPRRLEVARRNPRWTEIENDLVPRNGGRWLVSAGTDLIYQPVRGVVFQPHSITAIADRAENEHVSRTR